MIHLGKSVKEKHLKKVSDGLKDFLEEDEQLLAIYKANRIKPQMDGIVLTSKRLIALTGVTIGDLRLVSEISADDISKLTSIEHWGNIRLIATKESGEELYVCMMGQGDADSASGFLEKMSGSAKPITERMDVTKEEKRQAKIDAKKQQKETKKAKKIELKEAKAAAIKARGRLLGSAFLTYNGGMGSEYKKNTSDSLQCFENVVLFNHKRAPISIKAEQIAGFEVTGQKQTTTTSRLTATRMLTLGVFSLAAPKHTSKTSKESYVNITLNDGRCLFFYTSFAAPEKIHGSLADAISHYSSINKAKENATPIPSDTPNIAEAIKQFSDLRDQGIITDEEFEAKKKQLLEL